MKTVKAIALLSAVVVFASCSNRLSTKTYYDDDVYFSSKDLRNYTPPVLATPADTDSYAPVNRNSNVANAAPDYQNGQRVMDDYYDNQYASRIRRFYYPSNGWGYYDPWYTNSYWYDYNPYNFGTSVYVSYNFWPTSYTYWGFGNPYGYNPWYRDPFFGYGYNPYAYGGWGGGWGSPWMPYNPYTCGWGFGNPYMYGGGWGWNNPYMNGYNNGYWNGFNDGMAYNNYYFNGYDNNSYSYYGPMKQTSTSGQMNNSFGDKMQMAMNSEGQTLKFIPAVGSEKPVVTTGSTPTYVNPAQGGKNTNAVTTAPVGGVRVAGSPNPLGEKSNVNTGRNMGVAQPAETKPSITGKPIQVFDYNEGSPARGTNQPNTVNPAQGGSRPTLNEQPARNDSRPTYSEPQREQSRPAINEQPSRNQSRPDYSEPQREQSRPTYNEQPSRNNSRPQQNTAPSRNESRPQQNSAPSRNESRPSYNAPSRNESRPSYSAPSNNNNGGGNRGGGSRPSNSRPR